MGLTDEDIVLNKIRDLIDPEDKHVSFQNAYYYGEDDEPFDEERNQPSYIKLINDNISIEIHGGKIRISSNIIEYGGCSVEIPLSDPNSLDKKRLDKGIMHVVKYMFEKEIESELNYSMNGMADILLDNDWRKFDWEFINDLCKRHNKRYPMSPQK